MPFNIAALERRIKALEANRGASLRFGTVTEVSEADGTARVQLPDGQNMVSHPLRVMQPRTLKDKKQCFPDIGEPVACLFAGQGFEQGVVLGAVYSPKCQSPNQQGGQDYTKYEDGTEIWYDRKAHKLIAKVKGDSEIEAEGSITAKAQKEIHSESARSITLKAPTITLAGLLNVTDKNGNPGQGILSGDYSFINGSVKVPDGDVIAQAVSLLKHLHSGVQSGPSNTDTPINSMANGDPNHTEVYEDYFNSLYEEPPLDATDLDKLLLCLPEIAAAEAKKTWLANDKKGWLQLKDMFHRWFSGPANSNAEAYPNVFWVDIEWVLSYRRIAIAYDYMIRDEFLFHPKAQQTLAEILFRDGFLRDEPSSFDYTNPTLHPNEKLPWREWKDGYFQRTNIDRVYILPLDGHSASIGNSSLRALASGKTFPLEQGGHRIVVESVSIYVWDSFNFEGEDELGYWSCKNKDFTPLELFTDSTHRQVFNSDFNTFRDSHGMGKDFMVLSHPKNIDYLPRFEYVTKL